MEKCRNKAFIICTEFFMLLHWSKLSLTTMGPSCCLLLFKSGNNKKVRLAPASNLPARVGTWEGETIPTSRGWNTMCGVVWGSVDSHITAWPQLPDLPLSNRYAWASYWIVLFFIFLLQNGNINSPWLLGLWWGRKKVGQEKNLTQYSLAHSKN